MLMTSMVIPSVELTLLAAVIPSPIISLAMLPSVRFEYVKLNSQIQKLAINLVVSLSICRWCSYRYYRERGYEEVVGMRRRGMNGC